METLSLWLIDGAVVLKLHPFYIAYWLSSVRPISDNVSEVFQKGIVRLG